MISFLFFLPHCPFFSTAFLCLRIWIVMLLSFTFICEKLGKNRLHNKYSKVFFCWPCFCFSLPSVYFCHGWKFRKAIIRIFIPSLNTLPELNPLRKKSCIEFSRMEWDGQRKIIIATFIFQVFNYFDIKFSIRLSYFFFTWFSFFILPNSARMQTRL